MLQQLVEVAVLLAVRQDLQAVLVVPDELLVDVQHGQQDVEQVGCEQRGAAGRWARCPSPAWTGLCLPLPPAEHRAGGCRAGGCRAGGCRGPHAGMPGTWGAEHGWDECVHPIKSPCQLLAGGLICALTELGSQKLVGF